MTNTAKKAIKFLKNRNLKSGVMYKKHTIEATRLLQEFVRLEVAGDFKTTKTKIKAIKKLKKFINS